MDNPSHTNNQSCVKTAISAKNECGRLRTCFYLFTKISFKLTIDISMLKYKKYDLSNVKNFQKNSLFYP